MQSMRSLKEQLKEIQLSPNVPFLKEILGSSKEGKFPGVQGWTKPIPMNFLPDKNYKFIDQAKKGKKG